MGERFKYFEQLTMVARFVVQPQVSVQPVAVNGPRGRAVSVHHDQCHHGDIIMSNVQRRDVLIGSALTAAAVAAAKPAAVSSLQQQ